MKRTVSIILTVIMCLSFFALSACGQKEEPAAPAEVAEPAQAAETAEPAEEAEPAAEEHACTSLCEVCRRCTNAECTETACEVKCAGHETMYAVVVSIPADWTEPNLWAWSDPDGQGAFASWPGEPFTAMDNGMYVCYVPGFVNTIIVNANQGTDAATQTDGITIDREKNVLVTVAADKTATVEDLPADMEVPAFVEKFVIHANVPLTWETVHMWAWSHPKGDGAFDAWPGGEMTAELKDGEATGWYTGKVPTWINRLIINGNEASDAEKTADMTIGEPKEMWITIAKDLSYTISYTDPDKAVEDVTVHAQVPADWEAPACWAWSAPDGTNAFASWPGEALVQDGDWYTLSVPGWINSVIVNGNVGGETLQTVDLSVEPGKEIWVVVTAAGEDGKFTAEVTYEAP